MQRHDLPLRALFYCCRMISEQEGVEFSTASDDPVKYGNIKKVYSIWICTESAQKRANSIERYSIRKDFMLGSNVDTPRYDIMNALLIYISEKHDTGDTDNELIKMLTDLFNEDIDTAIKIRKLKEDYGLKTTREMDEEVTGMCTYADAIERKGIKIGQNNTAKLMGILASQGRNDDIIRASEDENFLKQLFKEFSSQLASV